MSTTLPAPDLATFFNPASLAFVGATEDISKFGGRVMRAVLEFGYKGRVYPVNPRYATLLGQPCYPSVSALPEAPDHVGIVIAAHRVLDTLKQCADRGARFATIFTSNFSETGEASGRALQDEIVAFARANGIRLLGPNCNGFINFVDAFAFASTAAIKGPRKPAGDVGLVCHSGGLGQMNIMWRAQEAGLGITYEVSCGNEADLDAMDFMRFMIDDERTRVIMVAVETIRDGRKFAEVARHAADREKPIVMLKFGRTDAGRRAAASHTGALTGADEVHDAAFRQYGVLRVTDCNELYEVAKLLRRRKWPRGNRAAALSGSGGHSVLMADLGAANGIDWVPYQDQTVNGLRELMPDFAGVSNPTDLTSALTGSKHLFEDALNVVALDEGVDVLIPVLVAPTVPAIETVVKLADNTDKAVAVLWTGYCPTDPLVVASTLVARGLPVYRDALTCLKAVRAAMTYGEFLRAHKRAASEPPVRPAGIDVAQAKELIAAGAGNMTERQSKEVLAAYGLHITQERLATNTQNAASSARDIGKPVALKIESPDIPHKTEANAIRLNRNRRCGGGARVRRSHGGGAPVPTGSPARRRARAGNGAGRRRSHARRRERSHVRRCRGRRSRRHPRRSAARRRLPHSAAHGRGRARDAARIARLSDLRRRARRATARPRRVVRHYRAAVVAGARPRRYRSRNRHQSLDRARARRGRARRRRAHHP